YAIFWTEEVLVFIMIWGVFIGAAAAAYDRAHLNMDLFSASIPRGVQAFLNIGIVIALLACCAFMMTQSWQVVRLFYEGGSVSVAAGVPKWIPHTAVLAGFALMAIAVLARLRSYIQDKS